MATFKTEIQNKRLDGSYNVRIRITHNREVKRISTNIYVTDEDITRGKKIKNIQILEQCESIIRKCREITNKMDISKLSISELTEKIKIHLNGDEVFRLDFLSYMNEKASLMKKSTGDTYRNTANALKRFLGRSSLDISEINIHFLQNFEIFLSSEPSQRGNNRKSNTNIITPKGGRAISKYLACIRAIHNKAKNEFNDEDRGIINIPYSPFNNYKIKSQPNTRKRALPVDVIQKIIDIPYKNNNNTWNRYNLAKDCFILSFGLIGMNSADLYSAKYNNSNVIIYNRQKTTSRRNDKAEMQVKIDERLTFIIDKYKDKQRFFSFYKKYSDHITFNRAINVGLKEIGNDIGIDDLEFYAARHSWATIARSSLVGIDKATIHEALNHVDFQMKVTDIYIEKDWSIIWEANKKVLDLFDWTKLMLMYIL